jgi:hypothetical protein
MADVLIGAAIGGGSAFLGGAAEMATAAAQGEVISSSRALNALLLQPAIAAVAGGAGALVGGALTPKMSYLAAIGKASDIFYRRTALKTLDPLTNYIYANFNSSQTKLLLAPIHAVKNMFASTAAGATSGAVYGALEDLTSGGHEFANDVKAGALMGLAAGFAGSFRIGKDYLGNIHGGQPRQDRDNALYKLYTEYIVTKNLGVSDWEISNPNIYQASNKIKSMDFSEAIVDLDASDLIDNWGNKWRKTHYNKHPEKLHIDFDWSI